MTPRLRSGLVRRLGVAAVIAATLVVAAAIIVHTPPVRAAVLRYAVATIQKQYGLRLDAASLDYNLASLRIALDALRVSAPGEPPFVEADRVDVSLARSIWSGVVAFDDVRATRMLVRIVRHRDGRTNLPSSSGSSTGDPAPLRIARLTVPDLRVDIRDEVTDLTVAIPAIAVALTPEAGRISLDAPADISLARTMTRLTQLTGDASFDGRDLHLGNLRLTASEGTARVNGTLALLRATPGIDATLEATADVQQAARWAMDAATAPRGRVRATGRVRGPFTAIEADLSIESNTITWANFEVSGVRARAALTPERLAISDARLNLDGGQVSGRAILPLGSGDAGELHAGWTGIEAERLALHFARGGPLPAGTINGELDAAGRGPLGGWTADGRVRVSDARDRRGRVALPGETRLRLTNGTWQLEGSHRIAHVAPVSARLRGRIGDPLARSTVAGQVTLGSTNLAALTRAISGLGLVDVPATALTGGTIAGNAAIAGTVGEPRVRFTVNSDDAATPAGGGRLIASGEYDGRRGDYTVNVDARDWRLTPGLEASVGGVVGATFSARRRANRLSGEGDVTASGVQWDTIRLGDLTAHVTLADRTAHVTATAPEFNLGAEADIGLVSPYPSTIAAATTSLDLARVLLDVSTPEPITGRVAARIDAAGPLADWRQGRARLEVTTLDARTGDLDLRLTEPARASYAGERITLERLEAAAGQTHLSASGALPVWVKPDTAPSGVAPDSTPGTDAIVAMLTGDLGEAIRAISATRIATVPVADAAGPVVVLGRITGALTAPAYAADLELGPASISPRDDIPPVTGVRVRAHLEQDVLELREAFASYQQAELTASGAAPLALLMGGRSQREATLHAHATNVTPSMLRPLVDEETLAELAGNVEADLQLATSSPDLADATGELRLDRFDIAVAGLPLTQREPTRVRIENGVARIAAWDWSGEAASFTLAGQLGLADRVMALQADGDVDLRLLTPYVRTLGLSVSGRMQPHVAIAGTIDAPRFSGEVLMTGGEARLANPRVLLSDLAARAVLADRAVNLVSLTGMANGGALTATGSLRYRPDAQVDTRLEATVEGMALDFPEGLRTELNAMLGLTLATGAGQPMPGGTLTGTVTILQGAYRDPLPVIAGLLASVRARAATTSDVPSPALEGLMLNVRLLTDDDLIVDNNIARLQMGADLRVIGTAAAPALSGRVDIRDGGQLYLGRNVYTVGEPSTIDFSNPTAIEPDLNITATTRAGGEDVQVTIAGTPDTLSPTLTSPSNPSLGEADLASLLLTGRTLEALPSEDAAVVGAEVLGNLTGDVLGFASRAVGLDVLRLGGVDTQNARRDPTIVATTIDPTTRLTFGKSLGRNIDVTLSQSLRDADAQTWIVDYLPTRQLALRFVSDDQDLRSYEFRHDVSLGGGPARTSTRTGAERPRVDRPRVTAVMLDGDLAFPERELRNQLALAEGDRFDFITWQRDRDRLQDYYIAHRHLAARVSASRQSDASGVRLTYEIDAGPETAIVVTGTALDAATRQRLESAWATSVFEGFLVDEAREIVRDALDRQGYSAARVQPALETINGVRTLTIAVDPGQKVEPQPAAAPAPAARPRVVGEVAFVGAASLPADAVRAATAVKPGDPADAFTIDEARRRLQALYRREGFGNARVTVRQAVHAAQNTADVTFDVDEGARQVIGAITIEGNRGIDTDVISRALRLEVGQPLRAQDWLDARRRVFDTGLFRRVDLATEAASPEAAVGAATEPMRVRVVVEEWPALRLRYGFQASEERPEGQVTGRNLVPGLNADVTRRTLFGRAITTGAAVQLQRRDRDGRVFFNAPTLASLPIASSLVVERSREEFAAATLVTDRSTVSWEERVRTLRNRLSLSSSYHFERNHTFDTNPSPDPLFPSFDVTVNIARLTEAAAWDTRDDAGNTTRGKLLSYTLEYGPGSLGSDIRFVRHLGQAYYFRTWRHVVFGSAARVGAVTALGGQQLIPSLKFFSGGSRSVRGVSEDGLGPRDVFGDPSGGDRLLVLNQEARFPIFKWVRGVGFIDAGNVFDRTRDTSPSSLAGSIGAGLRLVTPVALLRVDYGKQVWGPGSTNGSGRWYFGVGQTF
jgi:outer membrane protein assembly factor BamA/autotransporter translocation and assembly factor TamB